jgi:hypothetical protein
MDPSPMIVESNTPLEKVAQKAMGREKNKAYDHIIVMDKGIIMGTVSIHSILERLTAFQETQRGLSIH